LWRSTRGIWGWSRTGTYSFIFSRRIISLRRRVSEECGAR
jgi:hypothetical protein